MSKRLLNFEEALLDLKRLLTAIRPYLGKVVLGGGWAPYLYRNLQGVGRPSHPALMTFDFDVMVPPVLQEDDSGTLPELLKEGGFVPLTNLDPPVVIFQHGSWDESVKAPVYAEILTPLRGSLRDRSGNPKLLKSVQRGLTAQRLRYLDLLLHEPIEVDVGQSGDLAIEGHLSVRLPNPGTYLLQKALIHESRRAESQRKDLAYIYDVTLIWYRRVDEVRGWIDSVAARSDEWGKWRATGRDALLRLFRDVDADGPASVEGEFANLQVGPPVSAEAVFRVVRPFLEAVFGGAG